MLASDRVLAGRVGFCWGFAEGLFFFIVPDVYISFATLFSLRAGAMAWLGSMAGSMAAVATIHALMVGFGLDYPGFLEWVPGISPGLIAQVGRSLQEGHLPYTPLLVLSGVPLKVHAAVAFSRGFSLGSVLLWTVFARVVRIVPGFASFSAIHLVCRRRIEARPVAWCLALGAFWLAFYAFYFLRMSRS